MEKADPAALTGLFDLEDYQALVSAIAEVLHLPETQVQERLFREALQIGWNVVQAARRIGVSPHLYDNRMERLYHDSDAFIFELAVAHSTPYCREVDRRVLGAVNAFTSSLRGPRILALGDGIGSDSLRFAALGYAPTYFEFQSQSSNFALYRFQRSRLAAGIHVVHEPSEIPAGEFDVVVCREVLEHVPNPPAMIESIWSYLRDGGVAVITESFGDVMPTFPTHLASNSKYHGRTDRLFVDAGFRLLDRFPKDKPLVFAKTAKSDPSRLRTLTIRREPRVGNFLRRVGRQVLRLVPF